MRLCLPVSALRAIAGQWREFKALCCAEFVRDDAGMDTSTTQQLVRSLQPRGMVVDEQNDVEWTRFDGLDHPLSPRRTGEKLSTL
jgi:hypothetical protein